jgi:hypothetical protein
MRAYAEDMMEEYDNNPYSPLGDPEISSADFMIFVYLNMRRLEEEKKSR